jgi:hypothetical protein
MRRDEYVKPRANVLAASQPFEPVMWSRVDQAIADSKTAIARPRRRDTHRSLSNQIHLFVDSHFDEAGSRLTW